MKKHVGETRRETETTRMTQPNQPYFAYAYDAWSYVERAKKQLELFDAGNPESLFYAAFELRMGIEARLYDGLRALRQTNMTEEERQRHTKRLERLSPDKLFRKLETIDENTLQSSTLMIGIPGGQSTSVLRYTAVTKELANDHDRPLSKLLHYRFFIDNPEWYLKEKIFPNRDNMRSLMDYREMLGEIARRLEEASSGDLLAPPSFLLGLIDKLDESAEE
jgi:hypothetical protein